MPVESLQTALDLASAMLHAFVIIVPMIGVIRFARMRKPTHRVN